MMLVCGMTMMIGFIEGKEGGGEMRGKRGGGLKNKAFSFAYRISLSFDADILIGSGIK